jgi:hypothetical protein
MTVTPVRSALLTALPLLLLSLCASVVCYVATGPSTGLFFGGVATAALLVPPLVLAHDDRARQLITAAAIVDGIALPWLFAVTDPSISLLDFVRAYLLLCAWAAALWGIADLLRRARISPLFASALTVVLALAWLGWPIWLSPWIAGRERLVGWLVAPHPLFGLDAALSHLGVEWDRRPLMYTRLSVLNQDVFYSRPAGVGRATLLHGAVAVLCLLPYRRLLRTRRASPGVQL